MLQRCHIAGSPAALAALWEPPRQQHSSPAHGCTQLQPFDILPHGRIPASDRVPCLHIIYAVLLWSRFCFFLIFAVVVVNTQNSFVFLFFLVSKWKAKIQWQQGSLRGSLRLFRKLVRQCKTKEKKKKLSLGWLFFFLAQTILERCPAQYKFWISHYPCSRMIYLLFLFTCFIKF